MICVCADSSFIPPLIYAMMGSSRDLAVGTVAVGSLLMGSMLSNAVDPNEDPNEFMNMKIFCIESFYDR